MISVCLCTHNPQADRLARCLDSLRRLSPPVGGMEFIVVDNTSVPALADSLLSGMAGAARLVREPTLGLTSARRRALDESRGQTLVFVDDDNVLEASYVVQVERFFSTHPRAGVVGGRNFGGFDIRPPEWCDRHLQDCLAVRDLGDEKVLYRDVATPLGAGMAVRQEVFVAASQWPFLLGDRRGTELSSGGDSELCYRARLLGWDLWHAPDLRLHHLIDGRRLTPEYFDRLFRAMGRDRPRLELYWHPPRAWRRLVLLRRSLRFWPRLPSGTGASSAAPANPVEARQRFDQHFQRGMLEGLRELAWGPPLWNGIEAVRRAGSSLAPLRAP